MVQVQATLDRHLLGSVTPGRGEEVGVTGGPEHQPVLLHETVHYLAVRSGGVYMDGTVGEGGHALAILQASLPGGWFLGIDMDPHAMDRARQRLQDLGQAFILAQGNYAEMQTIAGALGFPQPDGILLDLGLSSFQLASQGRGFTFQRNEPLDMRFDPDAPLAAHDIVNTYPENDLFQLISTYGEDSRARSIARAIIQGRPIRTTGELADLVTRNAGGRRGKIHPATRTFQALRIAVNSELKNLEAGLRQAFGWLKPGGRLVVISYHSLEDRIVKQAMAQESKGCICPPHLPVCVCGHTPSLKLVSRRVVVPSADEVRANRRSRSARLRVAERL